MWVKTGAVVGLLSVLAGCSTDNLEDTAYTSEAVQEQTDSLGRTLSAAAARVAMENTSAARDLHLLARLEVRPGELLEFYEPSEDVLMISGAGALDDMLITPDVLLGRSAADVWAFATDGAPLPDALADAIDRASASQPGTPVNGSKAKPSFGGGRGPASQPTIQPLAISWCDTGYYSEGYGDCPGADFTVCLDDWFNGAFARSSDNVEVYSNVCAAEGTSVTFKFTSENGGGTWSVAVGTARYYRIDDWDCGTPWDWNCPDARADVQNATNDRFHFRYIARQ
jgi:hypothetical protein